MNTDWLSGVFIQVVWKGASLMFVVGTVEFGVIPGRKLSLTFGWNLTADKSREGQCRNEIIFEDHRRILGKISAMAVYFFTG